MHLTQDQAEDVVKDKVAASTVGLEGESLGVVHGALLLVDLNKKKTSQSQIMMYPKESIPKTGLLFPRRTETYQKSTGDHNDDATLDGGLSVQCRDLVLDLLEGQALYG